MNPTRPAFLPHLIVLLLCLWSAVTMAVPKAADQEEDEVTFSDAGAPPRRTTQPYRSPAAVVATPSVRPAKSVHKPVKGHARLERGTRHGKRLVGAGKTRQPGKASGRMVKRAGDAPKFKPTREAGKPVRTNARLTRFNQQRLHGARLTAKSERRHLRATKVGSRAAKHPPVKPRRHAGNRHTGRTPARR